jgi:adenylyl- and sulfurtransferase ThiI
VGKQGTQSNTQPLDPPSEPANSEADDCNSSFPIDSAEGACSDPIITVKQSLSATTATTATNENPVTFRVTCTRGGGKHSFSSMDAARCLGLG